MICSESFGALQVGSLVVIVLFYFVNEQLHAVRSVPYAASSDRALLVEYDCDSLALFTEWEYLRVFAELRPLEAFQLELVQLLLRIFYWLGLLWGLRLLLLFVLIALFIFVWAHRVEVVDDAGASPSFLVYNLAAVLG